MCRSLAITMLLIFASFSVAIRSNADRMGPLKVHSSVQCPNGVRVTARLKDGMSEFIVRIDPDKVERNELYEGRVTASCHLDLSLGKDKIARTPLRGYNDKHETVFRFNLSSGAAESSHLILSTHLHEKERIPTVGGGKTFHISLNGFPPSNQQSKSDA